MNWLVQPIDGGQIHVTPIDDYRPHDDLATCWCKPRQDAEDPTIWIHNSLDRRESYETGELNPQ